MLLAIVADNGGMLILLTELAHSGRIRVKHYNNVRLNSAIGYIASKDMLGGHQQEILTERDRKLEAAREHRKNRRRRAA
jgi:hypothetical protein